MTRVAPPRAAGLQSADFSHLPRVFFNTGVVALCSFVSPYEKDRELARQLHKGIPHFFFTVLPFKDGI
jgi:adenylylsulfate kinase-like enzyme